MNKIIFFKFMTFKFYVEKIGPMCRIEPLLMYVPKVYDIVQRQAMLIL